MTTNDSRRIQAHRESQGLPVHEEEKLLGAYNEPATAGAPAGDPIIANSSRGNVPAALKCGMTLMLILAVVSAVAVVIGLRHHKADALPYDDTAIATPGGSFVLEGSYAPQFVDARMKADYQPQAASTSTATAVSSDGRTRLVAISDPSTRIVYLFEVDDSAIPENATLNEFARHIADSGEDVTVVAYTDPTGSAAHNLDLSKRRAGALGRYLTSHGVNADQLTTIGKGVNDIYGSNDLDRRAELHL